MKSFLFLMFFFHTVFLSAQEGRLDTYLLQRRNNISLFNQNRHNKTNATESRLIAHTQEFWQNATWEKSDSSVYAYSGIRGGDLTEGNQPPLFDNKTDYIRNTNQWQRNYRQIRTYNTSNTIKDETALILNGSGSWENESRVSYTYNPSGRVTEDIGESWIAGSWENQTKNTWSYDANGNDTLSTAEEWDGTDWLITEMFQNVYNGSNISSQIQSRDNTGTLEYWRKVEWNYDMNNNPDTITYSLWNETDSSWDLNYRLVNEYSANNKTSELYQSRINNSWAPVYKISRTFSASKQVLTAQREIWNAGGWINNYLYTYSYDANDRLAESVRQNWVSASWVNNEKLTNKYAANGKKETKILFSWSGSNWEMDNRQSFTFNSYNQYLTSLTEDKSLGTFGNFSRAFFYYEEYGESDTTGFHEPVIMKSAAYPNPFAENTLISFESKHSEVQTLIIRDISGAVVYEKTSFVSAGENNVIWNAQTVNPGIYFYEIKSALSRAQGKLIKY